MLPVYVIIFHRVPQPLLHPAQKLALHSGDALPPGIVCLKHQPGRSDAFPLRPGLRPELPGGAHGRIGAPAVIGAVRDYNMEVESTQNREVTG